MEEETQTRGAFVVGFVDAVSEISPLFEEKIREILATNGIEDPEPEETYPAEAVVSSISELAEEVGPETTTNIGAYQITVVEWPEEVTTPYDGLKMLDDVYYEVYVNASEAFLGHYRYESTGENEGRAAVTANFPYPPSFARGVFQGVIEDLGSSNVMPRLEETEAEPDEKVAYEVRY